MGFLEWMIIGLICESAGAVLIALPILRNSRWNLDYLKELKKRDKQILKEIDEGTSTASNFGLARKIVEDELKFISRVEVEERNKKYDKFQTCIVNQDYVNAEIKQSYTCVEIIEKAYKSSKEQSKSQKIDTSFLFLEE